MVRKTSNIHVVLVQSGPTCLCDACGKIRRRFRPYPYTSIFNFTINVPTTVTKLIRSRKKLVIPLIV